MDLQRTVACRMLILAFAVACADQETTAPENPTRFALNEDFPEDVGPYAVGHTTLQVVHTDRLGARRPTDVHIWYPVHPAQRIFGSVTEYRSRLVGVPLIPGTYDAASFAIPARLGIDDAPIDDRGPRFPLLIWSHGSTSDALDHAYTGEAIASHGFVVAAIQHTGNHQDDVLSDFVNQAAGRLVIPCLDGLSTPCADPVLGLTVIDRARDVSAVISELERVNAGRFGDRIDVERVGMLGYSRGVLSAMAAVAGHSGLGILPEPRVDAIMTMSAGRLAFPPSDMSRVRVPVLMTAGSADLNIPVAEVRGFFDLLVNSPRSFVIINGVRHNSFRTSLCARVQSAAAVRQANSRAIIEDRTVSSFLVTTMGSSLDYCAYDTYVNPVDIRPIVKTMTGVDVTETNVPRLLDADELSRLLVRLAVSFFDAALEGNAADGVRFNR
ncbi:MAG TPA: hypothetical protein VGD49_08670, partial [Longimicrobiales bacterium]